MVTNAFGIHAFVYHFVFMNLSVAILCKGNKPIVYLYIYISSLYSFQLPLRYINASAANSTYNDKDYINQRLFILFYVMACFKAYIVFKMWIQSKLFWKLFAA